MPSTPVRWLETRWGFATIAVLCTALAVALRIGWVLQVQSPADAVYSDMAGYLGRALEWVSGAADTDRRWALYPPGTHVAFGIALWLLGRESLETLGIVLAVANAGVVPFAMAIARRTLSTPGAAAAVGLVVACWPAQLVFAGYFSSESPYMLALTASVWLWVRFVQTGRGPLVTGIVSCIAFSIRPPILLSCGLSLGWIVLRRRELPWLRWRPMLLLGLPFVAALGFSGQRFYSLTGEWGLISENAHIVQFFAGTDFLRIETRDAEGNTTAWFSPPPMEALGYTKIFRFEGWPADAATLERERERNLEGRGFAHRLLLLQRNIRLLALGNESWPEFQRAGTGPRKLLLQGGSWLAVHAAIPLALLGMGALCFRKNPGLEVVALHIATSVATAAVYLGEIRYRVPYDGLLIVLAVYAVTALLRRGCVDTPQEGWIRNAGLALAAAWLVLMVLPWGALV